MKKIMIAVAAVSALATAPAFAGGAHINVGFYAPAPVYYAPPVAYYPPVQHVYFAPRPVYYTQYRGHGWGRGHHHYRDYARNDWRDDRCRDRRCGR